MLPSLRLITRAAPFRLASILALVGITCPLVPSHAEEPLSFERHVRPILKEFCLDCHGATEDFEGGLDLRLRRFLVRGGDSGAAIVPGSPDESLLLHRVRDGDMPPGEKKVTPEQVEQLERWIEQGAITLRDEPEQLGTGIAITPEDREHWAFQPLVRPEVPDHSAEDRVRTPVDAFVLAELRRHGLQFSPDSDRATWLRRAAFDLTGLPPSPEELQAFLEDSSEEAYERALDRLLDSPHYGERWGRYWLDIAGYADSDGVNVADTPRPYAYKYRDYVIRSLNAGKPLNEFIIEQLAGDELVSPPYHDLPPEEMDKLIATGFLRMGADGTGSGSPDMDLAKNQVVADTIKIVSTSLLGLTVQCAQCHDHRYDPISHDDYHRLRALFEPAYDWKNWRTPQQRLVSLYTDEQRQQAADIEAEVAKILAVKGEKQAEFIAAALEKELEKFPAEQRDALRAAQKTPANERSAEQQQLLKENPSVNITPGVLYQYNPGAAEELKEFDQKVAAARADKPVEDFLHVLTEVPGHIPETYLFHRGEHRQPRHVVSPGDLEISLQPGESFEIPEDDQQLPTSGRRLAYARWLTSGRHPLLGRVLANRIWLHHFGQGIVSTPGDFGKLGTEPTHPELLDWLALELPEQDWSLKRIHKLLMLSTVYRQSSVRNDESDAIDSENRYYWRMPVRRLEAEAIRDTMLQVSGELNRTLYGPPISVSEDDVGQVVTPDDQPRRSVYLQVRRSKPVSFLSSFDAPVMETNCEIRPSSTVAPQSLMLMNSGFVLQRAETMASRVRSSAEPTPSPVPEWVRDLAERHAFPESVWSFGYGQMDDTIEPPGVQFSALPHWTGSSWQGGEQLPDSDLGWVLLRADGGHPGASPGYAAIRRWTAPQSGRLTIEGVLSHGSENGDGVRGRIVSSRAGVVLDGVARQGELPTVVRELEVQAGEMIDFVTDCRETVTSDSFTWTVDLTLLGEQSLMLGSWNSAAGFHGPAGRPLPDQVAMAWQLAYQRSPTREELQSACQFVLKQHEQLVARGDEDPVLRAMTNLCQALLTSNEFLYVD